MSVGFRELIGKALIDKDFRDALYAKPGTVPAGYVLSPDEKKTLGGISKKTMEEYAEKVIAGLCAVMVLMNPPPENPGPDPVPDPAPGSGSGGDGGGEDDCL